MEKITERDNYGLLLCESIFVALDDYCTRHGNGPAKISMTVEALAAITPTRYTGYQMDPAGPHFCGIPVDIVSGAGIHINLVEPEIQLPHMRELPKEGRA